MNNDDPYGLYAWFDEATKFVQEHPEKAEYVIMAAYAKGCFVGMTVDKEATK